MSPGVAARKRLGCGCKDAKAVAVAVSASSLCSATETSTATTATWRRARTHPSASASTGTLTVPSVSSSFLWEDAEAEDDGDEVDCKRDISATMPSFSGLLRQLNELEQSVMLWGRMKSPRRNYSSPPPPPPPLPSRPVQHRAVHSDDKRNSKEGQGNFSPPGPPPAPPPPLPLRPVQHRALHSGDKRNIKEGHGNFSPPPPSFPFPATQHHRRVTSIDKVNGQERDAHITPRQPPPLPLPQQQPRDARTVDRGDCKGNGKHMPPPQAPKHRKVKSCDNNDGSGGGGGRLDGSVAVVKQSEDPLGDFRLSMLNMIVENGIVTGDELRELLRRFLALNAPHHHDAILRAFAEIWDEVFASAADPPPRAHEADGAEAELNTSPPAPSAGMAPVVTRTWLITAM